MAQTGRVLAASGGGAGALKGTLSYATTDQIGLGNNQALLWDVAAEGDMTLASSQEIQCTTSGLYLIHAHYYLVPGTGTIFGCQIRKNNTSVIRGEGVAGTAGQVQIFADGQLRLTAGDLLKLVALSNGTYDTVTSSALTQFSAVLVGT
jgi:hypothetical protein